MLRQNVKSNERELEALEKKVKESLKTNMDLLTKKVRVSIDHQDDIDNPTKEKKKEKSSFFTSKSVGIGTL
jgi:hypothetical protein